MENFHVGKGIQWPLMTYIATQVTVISGCSSLLGSMGPRAHTKDLSQAVRGIVNARWVCNGLWRGSFLVKKIPMSEGSSVVDCLLFDSNVTQMAVMLGQYDSYGSLRPKGLVRHLAFVIGCVPSAQWVQYRRWRGSFLA